MRPSEGAAIPRGQPEQNRLADVVAVVRSDRMKHFKPALFALHCEQFAFQIVQSHSEVNRPPCMPDQETTIAEED